MGVLGETAVRIRADTSSFHAEASRGILGSVTKIAGSIGGIFAGIKVGKALFTDPIKQAGDFQKSINVLMASTDNVGKTFSDVSKRAQELGRDAKLPGVSAKGAADAMLMLGKAGFNVQDAMTAARGALLLSSAAETDGATSAKVITQSINAFGLQAKDTNTIVDNMAGFMSATGTSFDQFADSLSYVGAPARNAGQSFKETAAQLAILSQNGIEGSMAGTGLRMMLNQMVSPASKASKAFKEIGVHTTDANGKFVGMRSVITQLQPALDKMTPGDRSKLFIDAFGVNAASQARIILSQLPKHYDDVVAGIGKQGQAQKLADAATKGFNGALANLRNQFEGVQLQIGLKLLPIMTTFVNFLANNLPGVADALGGVLGKIAGWIRDAADWLGIFASKGNALNGLVTPLTDTQTRFEKIVEVVKTVASTIQSVLVGAFEAITEHVGSVQQIAIALGMGAAAFVVLTTAVKIYTAAQAVLNAVMAANPISIVVIAIAALVVGLTLLYQRSETARKVMDAAWAGIRTGAAAALGFITDTLIPNAIAAWDRFGPGVTRALSTVVTTVRTIFNTISGIVETVVDAIEENWRGVWEVIGPIAKSALDNARTAIKAVLDIISGIIKVFDGLLRGDWGDAWNALKGIARDALDAAAKIVKSTLTALADTAKGLADTIGSKIAAGIKTAAAKLAGLGGDLIGKIAGALSSAAKSAYSYALKIGKNIYNGVMDGIGDIAGAVANKLTFGAVGSSKANPHVKVARATGVGTGPTQGGAKEGGPDLVDKNSIQLQTDALRVAVEKGLEGLRPALRAKMSSVLKDVFNDSTVAVTNGVTRLNAGWRKISDGFSENVGDLAAKAQAKLDPIAAKFADAPEKNRKALVEKAAAVEKPIIEAFTKWVDNAKAAYDAKVAKLVTVVDAQFAKAQARLDKWKAEMTPKEALLAAQQAEAANAAVIAGVANAKAALAKLDADWNASWAKLLKTQAENMAKLKATQAATVTDEAIAGHEFAQSEAAAGPLAHQLLQAQQYLDSIKAAYAQGQVTQEQLFAANDAFQAAEAAVAEAARGTEAEQQAAADANTLLQNYNTWQSLLTQVTEGNAAIATQEATDAEARATAQAQYGEQRTTASQAVWDALATQATAALTAEAETERKARDQMYTDLSEALKKRHDRIVTHLDTIKEIQDKRFDKMVEDAKKTGGGIGKGLAAELRDSIPEVGRAAAAVAAEVKKYLKTASPSEKGPLSDLDHWWDSLAPTLLASLDGSRIKAALSDAVTPNPGRFDVFGATPMEQRQQDLRLNDRDLMDKLTVLIDEIRRNRPSSGDAPPFTVIATGGAAASVYASQR